jgi:hypothetical protein
MGSVSTARVRSARVVYYFVSIKYLGERHATNTHRPCLLYDHEDPHILLPCGTSRKENRSELVGQKLIRHSTLLEEVGSLA